MGSDIHLVCLHSKERKTLLDTKLNLSLNTQCKLLHISKLSLYYEHVKPFSTDKEIRLLNAIDDIYEVFPSYGYRRLTAQLQRDGYNVGRKLIRKAMKYMGIEALYPKPKATIANKEHYKYPYLLKNFRNDAGQIVIDRANKVWSTDITYIKLEKGFVYLAAIIDWHSKENTLVETLKYNGYFASNRRTKRSPSLSPKT